MKRLWFAMEGFSKLFESYLKKGWTKTPETWRMILCLAGQEILWKPEEAPKIINAWVERAPSSAKPVINGCLRTWVREETNLSLVALLPEALLKDAQASGLSAEECGDWLREGRRVFVHLPKGQTPSFKAVKMEWEGGEAWRLDTGESMDEVTKSLDGRAFVQNLSAARVSHFVASHSEGELLDYCAAPGGKSWQFLALTQGREVEMWESNQKRRQQIKQADILKHSSRVRVAEERPQRQFANVLTDVPCSNSGVLPKSPEAIRHYWSSKDAFADIQMRILAEAFQLVEPGGKLFYSTCSISPRENQLRLKQFAEMAKFSWIAEKNMPPSGKEGLDGAYVACLLKEQEM